MAAVYFAKLSVDSQDIFRTWPYLPLLGPERSHFLTDFVWFFKDPDRRQLISISILAPEVGATSCQ